MRRLLRQHLFCRFYRCFHCRFWFCCTGGGDLVIYSPNSEGLLNATIPLFEEKYGVNVELIQAGTGELVKRIQSEKNDPYADVLFGGSWSQMYTNEDLWEPYVSANDANVIDAYKNKCGFITGQCAGRAASSSSTPTSSATSRSRLRRSAEPGPEGQDRHCRTPPTPLPLSHT